jgi:hypothetical protein
MTQRQLFQLNSDKVSKLESILETPVLKEAIAIVRQECSPKAPTDIDAAKTIGAEDFLNKLVLLTKVNQKKLNDLDKEYIVQARRKLLSTGLYTEDEILEAERLSMETNNQPE